MLKKKIGKCQCGDEWNKIFVEFLPKNSIFFFLLKKAKSTFKDLKRPFPRISIAKREGKVVKIAIYILLGFQFLTNNVMERKLEIL